MRSDYERVLRQRSALLKSARARGGGVPRGLEVWDDQLATAGAALTAGPAGAGRARSAREVARAYSAVSGSASDTSIRYRPSFKGNEEPEPEPEKLAAAIRDALEAHRRAELERAVCLVGPHRDELELSIGGLPARGYASHGESWSMALALRLAGFEVLRAGGEDPVLILDDVFAELDAGRRDRLAALVAGADQVLVTAAVGADVPAELAGRG